MTVFLDKQVRLPEHASYSQINTYLLCGYQYFLGKVKGNVEEESVWSVGGSSFHLAVEMYDRENL